jgi:hypothetical protein
MSGNAFSRGIWLLLTIMVATPLGCSWRDKAGTKHTLILGIGLVSNGQSSGIVANDLKLLGLSYDSGGLMIGVGQKHDISIDPTRADGAIISVSSAPFSLVLTNWSPSLLTNTIHTDLHR